MNQYNFSTDKIRKILSLYQDEFIYLKSFEINSKGEITGKLAYLGGHWLNPAGVSKVLNNAEAIVICNQIFYLFSFSELMAEQSITEDKLADSVIEQLIPTLGFFVAKRQSLNLNAPIYRKESNEIPFSLKIIYKRQTSKGIVYNTEVTLGDEQEMVISSHAFYLDHDPHGFYSSDS